VLMGRVFPIVFRGTGRVLSHFPSLESGIQPQSGRHLECATLEMAVAPGATLKLLLGRLELLWDVKLPALLVGAGVNLRRLHECARSQLGLC
jgi:hypothetical protein